MFETSSEKLWFLIRYCTCLCLRLVSEILDVASLTVCGWRFPFFNPLFYVTALQFLCVMEQKLLYGIKQSGVSV